MDKIYLSGPMTGKPDHNFPAFHAAAKQFRELGWEVINPAEHFNGKTDLPRATYLRKDLECLLQCDAIALLPGWHESEGARFEVMVAEKLRLKFFSIDHPAFGMVPPESFIHFRRYPSYVPVPKDAPPAEKEPINLPDPPGFGSVLDEAKHLTSGPRMSDYDNPSSDFQRTSHIWTGILKGKLKEGECISPNDVALCMVGLKMSRETHKHKRDNLVDMAGYVRCLALITAEEALR